MKRITDTGWVLILLALIIALGYVAVTTAREQVAQSDAVRHCASKGWQVVRQDRNHVLCVEPGINLGRLVLN